MAERRGVVRWCVIAEVLKFREGGAEHVRAIVQFQPGFYVRKILRARRLIVAGMFVVWCGI